MQARSRKTVPNWAGPLETPEMLANEVKVFSIAQRSKRRLASRQSSTVRSASGLDLGTKHQARAASVGLQPAENHKVGRLLCWDDRSQDLEPTTQLA
jgi:hypothetical protein